MSGEKPQRQRRPVHPQLTFELSPAPAYEADDFLVSASNEQAFGMVNLWPHWPEQLLLLVGPRGAGKSHLGAIWAAKAQANQCSANSLAAADAEALAARPLLLENADQIGGAEAELFHLINLVRERGTALVLTARSHPALWGLRTADLLSRLRLAPVAEIGAPDEALVQAVLVKLLVERQLATDAGVVSYAAARLRCRARPRGLGTAKPDYPRSCGRCAFRLEFRRGRGRHGRRHSRAHVADPAAVFVRHYPARGLGWTSRTSRESGCRLSGPRWLGFEGSERLADAFRKPLHFCGRLKVLRLVAARDRADEDADPGWRDDSIALAQAFVLHDAHGARGLNRLILFGGKPQFAMRASFALAGKGETAARSAGEDMVS